jgi:HPr Serine kinase C-terminal domain
MDARTAPASRAAVEEPSTWVGSAFGLSLRSEFPLPGLEDGGTSPSPGREVKLALSREGGEPFAGAERLQEWHYPDGTLGLTIDREERRGYRFFLYGGGVFELAADGSRIVCRPDPDFADQWGWRRYLIGQVLPFAALLHGLEAFHASAVEIGGGAVLLAGGSGLGKSTLALNMHLAGAGFLADDSVAVEARRGRLVAYPAIATAKVRQVARDLLGEDSRGALLEVASEDEHEKRYRVRTAPGPLPLAAVCMLEPGEGPGTLEISEEEADPWELLGSTFNELVRDPARLGAQLDLCGRIAAEVRFLRVRVGPRPGPEAASALAAGLTERM